MIVLSCNNLNKSFGIDSILENVSFTVNEYDKIGIIGVLLLIFFCFYDIITIHVCNFIYFTFFIAPMR